MAAFNKFNVFTRDLALGVHNLSTHAFKIRITNSAPNAANAAIADITTVATGGGWTTDAALTIAEATLSGSTYELTFADATIECVGATMADFQYVVLYNSNDATGHLIGWWDYGTVVSLGVGEKLVLDFDSTSKVIKVSST